MEEPIEHDGELNEYIATALDGHEIFGQTRAECETRLREANRVHVAHCKKNRGTEMNFETVKVGDNIHVVVNGVISAAFVRQSDGGEWAILVSRIARTTSTLDAALELIARALGDWHTVAEAADRLVELGKASKPPAAQTMYRWLKAGRFQGAVRAGVGRGGGWRIPGRALREFERKGR